MGESTELIYLSLNASPGGICPLAEALDALVKLCELECIFVGYEVKNESGELAAAVVRELIDLSNQPRAARPLNQAFIPVGLSRATHKVTSSAADFHQRNRLRGCVYG